MQNTLKKLIRLIAKKPLVAVTDQILNSSGVNSRLSSAELGYQTSARYILRRKYPELVENNGMPWSPLNQEELKVFSQHGEDGIIAYVFSKVGVRNWTFVEFGIGDGTECNTANLAINFGWSGLMMDGHPSSSAQACRFYSATLNRNPQNVQIIQCFVTRENINPVIKLRGFHGEIDLLSIDIDGNDYWIWKAIDVISPRVVVIEYNASFGSERSVTIPYSSNFLWLSRHPECYHGASLAALTKLAHQKGYILIGCDSSGVNAFFVRDDVATGIFKEVDIGQAYFPHSARVAGGMDTERQYATIAALPLETI